MTASSQDSTPSSMAGLFLLLLLPTVFMQNSAVPATPTPSSFDPLTQPECTKKEHPKVTIQGQTSDGLCSERVSPYNTNVSEFHKVNRSAVDSDLFRLKEAAVLYLVTFSFIQTLDLIIWIQGPTALSNDVDFHLAKLLPLQYFVSTPRKTLLEVWLSGGEVRLLQPKSIMPNPSYAFLIWKVYCNMVMQVSTVTDSIILKDNCDSHSNSFFFLFCGGLSPSETTVTSLKRSQTG